VSDDKRRKLIDEARLLHAGKIVPMRLAAQLEKCCNGCPKPPKAPSLVLCENCLAKLNAKWEALFERYR